MDIPEFLKSGFQEDARSAIMQHMNLLNEICYFLQIGFCYTWPKFQVKGKIQAPIPGIYLLLESYE